MTDDLTLRNVTWICHPNRLLREHLAIHVDEDGAVCVELTQNLSEALETHRRVGTGEWRELWTQDLCLMLSRGIAASAQALPSPSGSSASGAPTPVKRGPRSK